MDGETWTNLLPDLPETGGSVEDIILQKADGRWVAIFLTLDNRTILVSVDYNPFTGERLPRELPAEEDSDG